jgi:hypothetical protein
MLSASPALAELATVSYPPQAATVVGGATLTTAVHLPNAGLPGFNITFALPGDYARNRTVRIVFYLTAGVAPCDIQLVPSNLVRRRIGFNTVHDLSGLQPADGSMTIHFPDVTVIGKTFELKPSVGFPGQRKGDLIVLGLQRQAEAPADTCSGSAFVQGIDIRYPLK